MIAVCLKTGEVLPCPFRIPTVAVLGNFDGVHIAHTALIRQARVLAECIAATTSVRPAVAAWYFEELPESVLPGAPVPRILTEAERRAHLSEAGAEYAFISPFAEWKDTPPDVFLSEGLRGRCNAVGAACGYDFRFGRGAVGCADDVTRAFPNTSFVLPCVRVGQDVVSSSRIRTALEAGDVERAERLLGRPFALTSEIRHGKHLGTAIGYPTVNQSFPSDGFYVLPRFGVYATTADIAGTRYFGVTNVGVRPTVDTEGSVNAETHLFDASGDLYGQACTLRFCKFLRPERVFDGVDALSAAIAEDVARAKSVFQII